ncbi:hypothetical protein K488DRAFT_54572 [Vararia minispora EC-137]|uniref:Uncharacterized protein n=1 Tax=Vararia minispora EC-137 TaxID=1314806 RepID=A0ACB8QFC2_9AGAM|nr:hypothetical protein K488DRAFT_54572 [Vararia minispora EC-137]
MSAAPASNDASQRLYALHVQNNALALANVKFVSSSLAGAVAGVLGFENAAGFALFAAATIFTTAVLCAANYKGKPGKFVQGGVWEIANPGQENLATFILAWTLFYGAL